MYSPQRHRVPYQKNPNTTYLNQPKRKSPEKLSFDEFLASKKPKLAQRSSPTAVSSRVPNNTAISLKRTPPHTNRMNSVSPRPLSALSPGRMNTITPGRMSTISPGRMSTISPGRKSMISPGTRTTTTLPHGYNNTVIPNQRTPPHTNRTYTTSPGRKSLTSPNHRMSTLSPGSRTTTSPHYPVDTIIPTQRTPPQTNRAYPVSPGRKSMNSPGHRMSAVSPNHRMSMVSPSRMSTSPRSYTKPSPQHRIPPTTTMKKTPSSINRTRNSLLFKRSPVDNHHHLARSEPGTRSMQEQKIKVCVRKRPLSKREIAINELDIAPLSGTRSIEIHAPK